MLWSGKRGGHGVEYVVPRLCLCCPRALLTNHSLASLPTALPEGTLTSRKLEQVHLIILLFWERKGSQGQSGGSLTGDLLCSRDPTVASLRKPSRACQGPVSRATPGRQEAQDPALISTDTKPSTTPCVKQGPRVRLHASKPQGSPGVRSPRLALPPGAPGRTSCVGIFLLLGEQLYCGLHSTMRSVLGTSFMLAISSACTVSSCSCHNRQ